MSPEMAETELACSYRGPRLDRLEGLQTDTSFLPVVTLTPMDFLTRSTPESYFNSMAYRAQLFSATGTKTGQTHREDVFLYACLRTPTTGYPIKAESKAEATFISA